jgi:outer membrane protein OmpA-like peptidoglycan-associated protein
MLVAFALAFFPVQATGAQPQAPAGPPVYQADAVSKSIRSINYQYRSGETKIGFQGTALMPQAKGEAKVEAKEGRTTIDAKFSGLEPANRFGAEYLTYVLFAITPEGRPRNLGELKLDGRNSAVKVTTPFQAFGLVVTAEPYFSVSQPSDLVVLENVVLQGTRGKIDTIDAKYELLQRGQYEKLANALNLTLDPKVPLELYEARNAVQIARTAGAPKYASDTFQKAENSLNQAEDYYRRKEKNPTIMVAREAAQTAEDARVITIRRMREEKIAQDQAAAAEREAQAKAKAEEESRLRAQADTERQRAEADRAAADRQRMEAELAAARAAQQKAEADAARANMAAQEQKSREDAERAEREKAELRETLLRQLNQVLETKDTERGLVVTMADVLFDTGKYDLRAGARERLARLAGIVLAHPGLKLDAEGHTDSTGSDDFNQRLSEHRAQAVVDYLRAQGIPSSNLSFRGEGSSAPVASNETAEGRQRNRRVELIVSGEAIGTKLGATARQTPAPGP